MRSKSNCITINHNYRDQIRTQHTQFEKMIEKAKYDNMFERQKAVAGMREKFIQTMQNRNLKTKQQMLSTFQQYGQRVIE